MSLADLYQRAGRPRLAARRILRSYEEEIGAMGGGGGRAAGPGESTVREFRPLRSTLERGEPRDGVSLLGFARRARLAYQEASRRIHQQRGAAS